MQRQVADDGGHRPVRQWDSLRIADQVLGVRAQPASQPSHSRGLVDAHCTRPPSPGGGQYVARPAADIEHPARRVNASCIEQIRNERCRQRLVERVIRGRLRLPPGPFEGLERGHVETTQRPASVVPVSARSQPATAAMPARTPRPRAASTTAARRCRRTLPVVSGDPQDGHSSGPFGVRSPPGRWLEIRRVTTWPDATGARTRGPRTPPLWALAWSYRACSGVASGHQDRCCRGGCRCVGAEEPEAAPWRERAGGVLHGEDL